MNIYIKIYLYKNLYIYIYILKYMVYKKLLKVQQQQRLIGDIYMYKKKTSIDRKINDFSRS